MPPKAHADAVRQQAPDREFHYNWADFELAREMIRSRAGVALADHKHHLVYSRLSKRLRVLGLRRFTDYLALLQKDPEHPEWHEFTGSLTTHLTAFFRESHHFDLLGRFLHERRGTLTRIWCSAASSGEEPYSIAMVAAESWPNFPQQLSIHATDIDVKGLQFAANGVYPEHRTDKLSRERLQRHFLRGTGKNRGLVRVKPALRDAIHFFPLNLLDSHWPVEGRFDVIFCRNVLIYFEREDQQKLVERLASRLNPGGMLFLGHSENAQHMGTRLQPIGKTAFRLNSHG